MPSLPTGTVTFLFTDIEGSTRLAESLGTAWPALLEEHRAILREAIARGEGTEVGTEGDSFFVAFPTAAGAVNAAVAAQRGLAAHAWPDGAAIRVRMGVHTGEGNLAGGDYVGLDVHRAARIAAAGHGGQILLSDATRALAEANLPEGTTLRDLGQRRLKDLSRPEQIHQLSLDGLTSEFPPLKTLDATPNNLPVQLSSFLGRERELAEVSALLEKTRLLTLTGPGGTGKSRLSLQIGARVSDRFSDGVFWVPLATIRDPDLLPGTIAQELGLPDRGGLTPMTALINYLRQRRVLLILDNFEQVTDAASHVSELLAAAPELTVLATSRSALRIYGEREYPVPPLAAPDPRNHETVESISQYEAVALFIERAMGVKPDFTVTNDNAPAVAEISSRLDGLPLAIELAAARINVLTPQAMLARLGDRLSLLSGGGRDRPERQQTLRGAIDWSYELLSPDEATLFRRLAIFVGGARLDAIESICPGDELSIDILDGLTSLVDKSLLRQVPAGDGEPRFLMLGTIREYALDRLGESGRADELGRRHAEHFAGLVAQALPQLLGSEKRQWLDWLEEDNDNLRAALDWSLDAGETALALRLVAGLWRFWQMRGYLVEGSQRARRALALPNAGDHPLERADALEAEGGLAWWMGDFEAGVAAYRACLELRKQIGDPRPLAEAYYNLSFPLGFGFVLEDQETDEAYELIEQAMRIFTELGDRAGIAKAEWAYLTIGWRDRDFETARGHGEAALPLFRELGDQFMLGWSLYDLGLIDLHDGKLAISRDRLAEALAIFRDAKDVSGYTLVLDGFAALAMAANELDRAARIAGAVANLERLTGTGLNPANRVLIGYDPSGLRDKPELLGAWEEGSRLTIDDAIAYALETAVPSAVAKVAAVPDGPS
jgi:predicted ATPase/class 3 adenylate cyclase